MIYQVEGLRLGGGTIYIQSNSRNARKHLVENDLIAVSIYDNKGRLVSHAETYANMVIFRAVRK